MNHRKGMTLEEIIEERIRELELTRENYLEYIRRLESDKKQLEIVLNRYKDSQD